jgi:phosphonopyruvate decarboxylase
MLKAKEYLSHLQEYGFRQFYGVPDSLLKELCACISDQLPENNHVITANEGNAIAMAAGYNFATGNSAVVYMQNSGLGNCVNPLTSLADPKVYSVPMLLVVGWRGEPGVKDEPQHVKKGEITPDLLQIMGIKYEVLSKDSSEAKRQIESLAEFLKVNPQPVALLVKKNSFEAYSAEKPKFKGFERSPSREEYIKVIEKLSRDDNQLVLSTTGKPSRELYEARVSATGKCDDFLNVGAMGHVSQVALAVAVNVPSKKVVCLDGDGASLMHLGGMATIAQSGVNNLIHIILNNSAHESVGGQRTLGDKVNFVALANSLGYQQVSQVRDLGELEAAYRDAISSNVTCLIEAQVSIDSRKDLGRPKETPIENKNNFIAKIR